MYEIFEVEEAPRRDLFAAVEFEAQKLRPRRR